MEALKTKIQNEGHAIGADIVKVDNFLNHQIDVAFMDQIGEEFYRRFEMEKVDKILTIEASGIAIGMSTARCFNVPLVFAKKNESKNLDKETYTTDVFSFTKNKTYAVKVSKKYIQPGENILIVDDFLANGKAALGLMDIIEQAGAKVAGIGIVIEKSFQPGGDELREKGIRVESLAMIDHIEEGKVFFK